jgi:hypothetical protein
MAGYRATNNYLPASRTLLVLTLGLSSQVHLPSMLAINGSTGFAQFASGAV